MRLSIVLLSILSATLAAAQVRVSEAIAVSEQREAPPVPMGASSVFISERSDSQYAVWYGPAGTFGALSLVPQRAPVVATDGSAAMVAWSESGQTRVARVGRDGSVSPSIIAGDGIPYDIAFDGRRYLLLTGNRGQFLTAEGALDGAFTIDGFAAPARLAWDGAMYVIVHGRGVMRVTESGSVLPIVSDLPLADAAVAAVQGRGTALVAFGTRNGLETTIEGFFTDEPARRFMVARTVSGTNGSMSVRYYHTPRVHCGADECVVTWAMTRTGDRGGDAFGATVRLDGTVRPLEPSLGTVYYQNVPAAIPFVVGAGYLFVVRDSDRLTTRVLQPNGSFSAPVVVASGLFHNNPPVDATAAGDLLVLAYERQDRVFVGFVDLAGVRRRALR